MKVLVAEPIAEEGIRVLQSKAEVDLRLGLKSEELQNVIGEYEGLIVRSQTRVTAGVIEAGQRLQVIGRAGVGTDNIDVEAATRRGIVVVNSPEGNIGSAAEHTIALLLALARNIPQAHLRLKQGVWEREKFTGVEVRNKILGIVGLGRVGSEVARRAKGLGMKLIAYDPLVSLDYAKDLGVEPVSKEELLRSADFITLHLPLSEATKGFIGARELALMKPSARLINTARGGIVDEEALYRAVEGGRIAGAAVDVFTEEPTTDSILLKSDKIIVTPHLGASTVEAQTSVALDIAHQVLEVLEGRPARYAVNLPITSPELFPRIAPFLELAHLLGRIASQLAEGQPSTIYLRYEGEIASWDTEALKAAAIGGFLESTAEERINLVNANFVAQGRGLKMVEQRSNICENYSSLTTLEVETSAGKTVIAGTTLRGEPHIVRVGDYWIDFIPSPGYWLFSDHLDRPGLIGAVGLVTGEADINISSMHVARLKPRGPALMVLRLDEPLTEEGRRKILAIPDIYTVKVVKV